MKGGHWLNDPALVRTLVTKSASSVYWLLAHGGDLRDVGLMAGASQPRTHRPTGGALVGPEVVRTLYTAAKNLKIDVRTNTHAEQILTDKSGRVVGLKVKGKDGTYTIHSKAVVDAGRRLRRQQRNGCQVCTSSEGLCYDEPSGRHRRRSASG